MARSEGQRISLKQEKRTAQKWGGRRSPMSGGGDAHKNDVSTVDYLIENKTKVNPGATQITIKARDLEALTHNAIVLGKIPLLQFDLNGRRYIIIREDDGIEQLGVDL